MMMRDCQDGDEDEGGRMRGEMMRVSVLLLLLKMNMMPSVVTLTDSCCTCCDRLLLMANLRSFRVPKAVTLNPEHEDPNGSLVQGTRHGHSDIPQPRLPSP